MKRQLSGWSGAAAVGLVCLLGSLAPSRLQAQNVTLAPAIKTVAGNGTQGSGGDNGPATSAQLFTPNEVAVDSAGNLYIADQSGERIRKVDTTGKITTVAGTGTAGYNGDNMAATSAELNNPAGVAVDSAGNLYIADENNNRIRKVDTSGNITTVAGTGTGGYNGDGIAATTAKIFLPYGVAVDSAGNFYIADTLNYRIRKVSAGGTITTVAGNGMLGSIGDNGPATSAELSNPEGVAVDSAGNVYIGDTFNQRVREVNVTTGTITTVAGTGGAGYNGDNMPATSADLTVPYGVVLDSAGNLYIADQGNNRIRRVDTSGNITTVAGNGTAAYNGDNIAASIAEISGADGVALDSAGNLYIADYGNYRVRKVTKGAVNFGPVNVGANSTQNVYLSINTALTLATVQTSGDYSVQSDSCALNTPLSANTLCTLAVKFAPSAPGQRGFPLVATDSGANLYNFGLEGTGVGSALAFTPGIITTVAGNGTFGYNGDNIAATSAELGNEFGAAVDSAGNLYIADSSNQRIRKVDASGTITTVAGGGGGCPGQTDSVGDGCPATSAELAGPTGVAVDSAGNIYIADLDSSRVRKVDANGTITTVAGNGNFGYNGDNIPATSAELNSPYGVAVDSAGNLYIVDYDNQRIRKVDASGIITTVAGNGTGGYSGDNGPATSAELFEPYSVAVDSAGNLYIVDFGNGRIRKVDTGGIITTVAGNGTFSYNGDNIPATSAALGPSGVTVDSAGNLYIADINNNRIRKVDASGIITTVAGNGTFGYNGDNIAATSAELENAFGVAVDSAGNLYIADSSSNRIRKVNVSTLALSFGSVNVGQTSAAQSVAVSDVGNAPLNFSSILPSANFVLQSVGNDCVAGTPLAVGATCEVGVAFAPTMPGNPLTGTVTVSDDAFNTPQAVSLSGTGTPAAVSFSPTSLVFPNTTMGLSSEPMSVTLTNSGTGALNFSAAPAITGANMGDFTITANTCVMGTQVAANGGTCTVTLTFKPSTTTMESASLNFADDAAGSPQMVSLSGTGVTPGTCTITFTGASGGLWGTAANWSTSVGTGVLPGPSDTVCLGTSSVLLNAALPAGNQTIDLITATGGTLTISGGALTIDNTTAANPTLNNLTISGGTLFMDSISLNVNGTLTLSSGSLTINGPAGSTAQALGPFVWSGGTILGVPAGAIIPGVITKGTAGTTSITGPATLDTAILSFSTGVTFSGTTANLTLANGAIAVATGTSDLTNSAGISQGAGAAGTFENNGTINKSGAGTTTIGIAYTNGGGSLQTTNVTSVASGTLVFTGSASGGGGFTVATGDTLTFAGSLNTGGSITGAGTVNFASTGAAQNLNRVTYNLTGAGATNFTGVSASTVSFTTCTITNLGTATVTSGSVTLTGGTTGSLGPLSVNGGTLTLATGQPSGVTFASVGVNSGSLILSDGVDSNVTINSGMLQGAVTIIGNLSNVGGTVAVGPAANSPGILTISGNYTQGATGVLNTVIGGLTPGTQYSQLGVTGNVSLAGTITGIEINGFVPAIGNSIQPLVLLGTITGTFATNTLQAPGGDSWQLTYVPDTSPEGSVTATLAASAVADFTLSASPSPLTVAAGTSGSYTATVSPLNGFTGTVTLSVSGLPAGATSTTATVTGGTGSAMLSISTAATTPAGSFPLTITGTSGALSHTASVTLVVTEPVVGLASSLSFPGTVAVGSSSSQMLTLTNSGPGPLTFAASGAFAITGTNAAAFTQMNTCPPAPTTLAAGLTCTITVTFKPAAPDGTKTATLTVTDNASNSPQTVMLTGQGATVTATLSTASINFGAVPVGTQPSPTMQVTVSSSVNIGLNITGITITGPQAADYKESDNCNASDGGIGADSSCTITVTFTPTVTTLESATLTITDNATSPGPQQTVSLLGGMGAGFTLTVPPPASGGTGLTITVLPGDTAVYTLLITCTPGVTGTITLAGLAPLPPNTILTITPSMITCPSSMPVTVQVKLQTNCVPSLVAPWRPVGPGSGPVPGLPGTMAALWIAAILLAAGMRRPGSLGTRQGWARQVAPVCAALVLAVLVMTWTACVSNLPQAIPNAPTTPAGNYPLTIVATGPSGAQVQVVFTVHVI